jgi:broad specificity phosphatase PhoE
MRHAEVAYFEADGSPRLPRDVALTAAGEEQARAAGLALADVTFDRVVASGLPRTLQTARLVASVEPESWRDLRELEPGRLSDIAEDELETAFTRVFRGVVPETTRFLGGETVGELFDRVLPALERLLADDWDTALAVLHGGVNRAILSYALTARRTFLGSLEQAPACINVLDVDTAWVVRLVNHTPYDPAHLGGRLTTMEELYAQYLPYRRGGRDG